MGGSLPSRSLILSFNAVSFRGSLGFSFDPRDRLGGSLEQNFLSYLTSSSTSDYSSSTPPCLSFLLFLLVSPPAPFLLFSSIDCPSCFSRILSCQSQNALEASGTRGSKLRCPRGPGRLPKHVKQAGHQVLV